LAFDVKSVWYSIDFTRLFIFCALSRAALHEKQKISHAYQDYDML